jgi:heme d1 biosynthesis radical SAM protein NirJ
MFRISRYLKSLRGPVTGPAVAPPTGPVVIWNLIRRCNLNCLHCYSTSADRDFPGELSTDEVYAVMDDLRAYGVSVLILSGGEPLLRPDIFDISHRAKELGFYVGLSSNGTRIDEQNIDAISTVGYDYVGVSLDGLEQHHDWFRRQKGAFQASLRGIRLCRERGIKVGMRFTLAQENAPDLPGLLDLMNSEQIDKFYLSHLNYSGRGDVNRKQDAYHRTTRWALDLLFQRCWDELERGVDREYVTGNNDADGVYLLHWVERCLPDQANQLRTRLQRWGGNASGIGISNIDNLGNVHADTFWWHHSLGNVRERPFSAIWEDLSDPILAGLRQKPRPLKGRCAGCGFVDICGGNTRVRAYQITGDLWAEDPGCYLTDSEIEFKDNPQVHAPLVDMRPERVRRRHRKSPPMTAGAAGR